MPPVTALQLLQPAALPVLLLLPRQTPAEEGPPGLHAAFAACRPPNAPLMASRRTSPVTLLMMLQRAGRHGLQTQFEVRQSPWSLRQPCVPLTYFSPVSGVVEAVPQLVKEAGAGQTPPHVAVAPCMPRGPMQPFDTAGGHSCFRNLPTSIASTRLRVQGAVAAWPRTCAPLATDWHWQ